MAWDDEGSAYLVFRGTASVGDWIKDAKLREESFTNIVPNYGKVHGGFYQIYTGMKGEAIAAFNQELTTAKRLFITGHSLGCGISTLAVPDLITHTQYTPDKLPIKHYNFASPRVGNIDFAKAYNQN